MRQVTTGVNATEARATTLMKIAAGTSTATAAAEIAQPYLGGTGDMTGRYSSEPPQIGQWQWIHDTNYPGALLALIFPVLSASKRTVWW